MYMGEGEETGVLFFSHLLHNYFFPLLFFITRNRLRETECVTFTSYLHYHSVFHPLTAVGFSPHLPLSASILNSYLITPLSGRLVL